MADPLSIAASVAGLAAVAGKVVKILYNFVSDIDDAPHSARSTLDTVNETRLALEAIRHLVETIESVSAWRKTLISLEHVGLTLSNCIMTLSELEALVVIDDDASFFQRIHWVRVEGKVQRLLPRLESQKTSLSLMVTVLQCQSNFGALRDRVKLQSTIDRMSGQNQDLARRVRRMETLYTPSDRSTIFTERESRFRPASRSSTHSTITTSSELTARPASSGNQSWTFEPREFEADLESSWVYARVAPTTELDRTSLRSTIARSIARSDRWSILKGKSLSEISVLSVYRLPITVHDIAQLGPNLTFERILLNQQSRPRMPLRELREVAELIEEALLLNQESIHPRQRAAAMETRDKIQELANTLLHHELRIEANAASDNNEGGAPGKAVVNTPAPNANRGNTSTKSRIYHLSGDTDLAKAFHSRSPGQPHPDDIFEASIEGIFMEIALPGTSRICRLHIYDLFKIEDLHSRMFREKNIALLFTAVGFSRHLDGIERKWLPAIFRCPGVFVILLGIIQGEKTTAERYAHRTRSEKLLQEFGLDGMAIYAEHNANANLEQVLKRGVDVFLANKADEAPDPVYQTSIYRAPSPAYHKRVWDE
ncbi:hypothetical protein QBC39DRAFT_7482 [Podospora conica]|nr:hypothetical protein QBC39DRAFT_7482 [Schizothecium conicum]